MKTLTILVPVYNTEKYIRRCLDSVAVPEVIDDLDIIVVSDGSQDGALAIAREYETRWPDSVRTVDKENGGHGSTINKGLGLARGTYFRVLDSDDWFNTTDFMEFVKRLKNESADLVVADYRKEFIYSQESVYLQYRKLKDGVRYEFDTFDLELLQGEYFVMATSTYRTEVLRESGLKLFEKTFYVDMQYNIIPITKVKDFVYYDLDIYRYFIGRKDQSMNLQNFVRNQDHHKKVMKSMIGFYTDKCQNLSEKKKKYLRTIIMYTLYTHYTIYCAYDENHERAYREITAFDAWLYRKSPQLYHTVDCMGLVRWNRKTKFAFVKINGRLFKKVIFLGGKISGAAGRLRRAFR